MMSICQLFVTTVLMDASLYRLKELLQ